MLNKQKNLIKSLSVFIINLMITLLSIFCSIVILKILLTHEITLSNYLLAFGLICIGFLLVFIYIYKLINYLGTIYFLKKIKLDQINREVFDEVIKKIKFELNPVAYLVLGISVFVIFSYIFSQNGDKRIAEFNKLFFINKLILSLIFFAIFELLSVIFIFAILRFIKDAKKTWYSLKTINFNLYTLFLKIINFLAIKFLQIKEILLFSNSLILNIIHVYDSEQRNTISIKRTNYLNQKAKGDTPPTFSFF
ncbi:hypothetical protein [Spiroplasma diminutum]|uniref:Transmembrane protein n=1 Tax=Spiroplasma diminutum CUAS-1 TaxID=1276221 RepID=S5MK84_9MOLU|nr:hypothetical protein [Spiroplasma diminutum]AGR42385.1 hypothetical protein SDIMI_v3c06810 [Spiroplasma diminutum CUAS-1]